MIFEPPTTYDFMTTKGNNSMDNIVKKEDNAGNIDNTYIPTKSEKVENLKEGSLLVVTVGNKDFFPSASDLKMVGDLMKETFKDSVGVKIVVIPQAVKIEKLSLPQLRAIINEVMVAPEESKDKYDPIINMDL